ncbi:hypothetical protein DPEC_G00211450 [Dallia pectoralis]|uniref:Uncharacterized protein n=1 Tax=Dallia pectoralis TaxID=75939 RepID=A0ACC2G5X2_DALPE|nr:hypothetical protein DPEC_G00211450 [Dallia pectoralis]
MSVTLFIVTEVVLAWRSPVRLNRLARGPGSVARRTVSTSVRRDGRADALIRERYRVPARVLLEGANARPRTEPNIEGTETYELMGHMAVSQYSGTMAFVVDSYALMH